MLKVKRVILLERLSLISKEKTREEREGDRESIEGPLIILVTV